MDALKIASKLFEQYFKNYDEQNPTPFQKAIIRILEFDKNSALVLFLEQYDNLEEYIADKPTRIKAAFKASKVTPGEIQAAIVQHLQKLEEITTKIQGNLDSDIEKEKLRSKQELAIHKHNIDNVRAEIEQLGADIKLMQDKLMTKSSSLEQQKQDIQQAEKDTILKMDKITADKNATDKFSTDVKAIFNTFNEFAN